MPNAGTWVKMIAAGSLLCIGGPALVYYVTPTEEEIFKKYNPELQKRSLQNRKERQEDFDSFVNKLKEYSKSDKPIWFVAAEEDRKKRALVGPSTTDERKKELLEAEKRRQEMRNSTAS